MAEELGKSQAPSRVKDPTTTGEKTTIELTEAELKDVSGGHGILPGSTVQ